MISLNSFIAKRFLFSPKSHSVINIVSRVSMFAVGIPVAAMVVLVSVFSGFDSLIRRMYADFDADYLIRPVSGKVFDVSDLDLEALGRVAPFSVILEEQALVEYRGRQVMATVRGVDDNYETVVPVEEMTFSTESSPELPWRDGSGVVMGQGVAYELGLRLGFSEQPRFFAARRGSFSALLPVGAFSTAQAPVTAIFSMDADTDGTYVFVPLEFARGLFDYRDRASGVMVGGGSREVLSAIVGDDFEVLTRAGQRPGMYRVMAMEKWVVFFISLAVLIIASFSIVGSLVMLILDKRQGIALLRAMGASAGFVRRVFVGQGVMIGMIGAVSGLVLGVAVCAVQQIWGVVPMPGGTFLIDSYPVSMQWADLGAICVAFIAVIYLMSIFTVPVFN